MIKNSVTMLLLVLTVGLSSCLNDSNLINGTTAPDIELPDMNHEIQKLSDLRGNLVLVDFWASWCQPCRKQSPKLRALYEKYSSADFKDAGSFKIYSVSLDTNYEKWLRAIEKDQLAWPHHVSNFEGWKSSPVIDYDVSSIPSAFLLDQNGMIIGKNLKARDLDAILSRRLEGGSES